jgi:hypothetical protein
MGIDNFFRIENTNKKPIKDIGIELDLSEISGQTIGCDALFFIYGAILANPNMCDESGNRTAHLNTLLLKTLMFRKHNITAIWIFDNPVSNAAKTVAKEKRTDSFKVDSNIIGQCLELLKYLGVECRITGPNEEAEHYGSHMCITGELSYFMSGDSDVIAFGGKLIKPTFRNGKTSYTMYITGDVLGHLGVDKEGLAKISVIMGNDFCKKTPKIGAKTVIKKYNEVELTECQIDVMNNIYLKPFDDINIVKIQGEYNKDAVIDMLVKHSFSGDRLKKMLKY